MVLEILQEAATSSLFTLLKFAAILIPLMIGLEYLEHFGLLNRISSLFEPFFRLLTFPKQAVFPLVVGLFVGLLYGAAIIIEYARNGVLSRRDVVLMGIFLGLNHSIIEDNLIFAVLGAGYFEILVIRFVVAFIVTRAAAWYLDRNAELKSSPAGRV